MMILEIDDASHPYDTYSLLATFDLIARDYSRTIQLTRELPATDARRCRQKARGRYHRLLRHVLMTEEWLFDLGAS